MTNTMDINNINNVTLVKEETEMKDNRKLKGEMLCKMLVGAWVWSSTHKYNGLLLFYKSRKYEGQYMASTKRLMRVTGDVVEQILGKEHNNYKTIIGAYRKMASLGFCHMNGSDVFISDDERIKLVRQYNKLKENSKKGGYKTMKDYILQ